MDNIMQEMEKITKIRAEENANKKRFMFQGADAIDVAEIVENLKA